MKRVVAISNAILRNWIRSRSGVFFSLLFPVLLMLIFSTVFSGGGSEEFTLYLQNRDVDTSKDATELSSVFIGVLNKTGAFNLELIPYDTNARKYVEDQQGPFGGAFRLLIVHEGFESNMINGTFSSRLKIVITTLGDFVQRTGELISKDQQIQIQTGMQSLESLYQQFPAKDVTLEYVADPSNTGSSIVKSIISKVADSFYYEVLGVRSTLNLQEESIVERRFSAVDYYLPGLTAAFVMTNGVIGVTTSTTEFRRRGVLKRLATTPLSRLEWVLGNVFSQTALSFLLVAVMITISWAVFGLQAIPDALALLLIIAGSILFSGMGLLLAGFISDVEAASAAGNAVAFPMMFLSGSFYPIDIMPNYLQLVARALPLTYFTDGLRSSLIYHHTPSALLNLGIVAALALVFIMIGSVLTRWRER